MERFFRAGGWGSRQVAQGWARWAWLLGVAVFGFVGEAGAAETRSPAAPEPRLELTVTGPQKAAVGTQAPFEIEVRNVGNLPATNLLVIDHFDAGLVHEAAESPIEHDLKPLRPGESQRLRLTFRVARPGRLTHQVTIAQQGKVITVATASVIGEGSEEPDAGKPDAGKPDGQGRAKTGSQTPAPAKPPKPKPSPREEEFEFPEIPPRAESPQEDPLPDLGPPLVDRPEALKRLHDKFPVWIDREKRSVVLVGVVCQRQSPLELFACLRNSKEHEAVLSVPTKAAFVHAALLAVGAEPGSPVQFRPKYVPASGTEIEITCVWKDAKGRRQTARAQDWVRNAKTGKALDYPWVFAGSRFQKNSVTGETYYQADADGDLICVSNFPGAMLDLPIQSTASDSELLFEGFTEHIPPRGTPVTLILTPKPKGEKAAPAEKK